jgi:glycosyltransferase involved in cell wall biosynthesis
MQKQILILVNSLGTGGSERNVALLCKHIDKSRYLPTIWTIHEGGRWRPLLDELGIRVRCFCRRRAWDPLFAYRFAREISKSSFHLTHAFLPTVAFYAAVAKKCFRCKVPFVFSSGASSFGPARTARFYKWAIRQADYVTANSPSTKTLLEEAGVDAQRIAIVPNGHELNAGRSIDWRQYLPRFENSRPVVISVGRLIKTKRICDLIRAAAMINESGRMAEFVIVGDGPEMDCLKGLRDSLGLRESVEFLGHRTDVANLLASSDVFAFPSEAEGLPNAVIEAALAGVPIVAADIDATRSVVDNVRGGALVPPRNPERFARAIMDVLANPKEAETRAEYAKSYAMNRYTVDAMVEGYYGSYEAALGDLE